MSRPYYFLTRFLGKTNVNEMHFLSIKKGASFNFAYEISPIIAKNKNVIDILEKEMLSFRFMDDSSWHYDPLGFISVLNKHEGLSTYAHESRSEEEKVMNVLIPMDDITKTVPLAPT